MNLKITDEMLTVLYKTNCVYKRFEDFSIVFDLEVVPGTFVTQKVNVFQVANLCKKRAYEIDKYEIESGYDYSNIYGRYSCSNDDPLEQFLGESEPDAVFKAFEWCLKDFLSTQQKLKNKMP